MDSFVEILLVINLEFLLDTRCLRLLSLHHCCCCYIYFLFHRKAIIFHFFIHQFFLNKLQIIVTKFDYTWQIEFSDFSVIVKNLN